MAQMMVEDGLFAIMEAMDNTESFEVGWELGRFAFSTDCFCSRRWITQV